MHGKQLTPAGALVPLMMLAGCASLTQGTNPGTPTGSVNPACLSMEQVHPNRGKPGPITTGEISAVLSQDHPVERVRNLVGDNSSTLTQVDKNNAALVSLCGR